MQASFKHTGNFVYENDQLAYIPTPEGRALPDGNGGFQYQYYLKDHLGSLYALTDENGNIAVNNGHQQIFSFDPWGRRRNPTTWTFNNIPDPDDYLIDRGFTGHQHLDEFGLVNMNGRMYDPLLGRMLSPDNFVQTPEGTQGFNRYSYALNNPLVYVDPDGKVVWFVPVIIGAVVGGTTAYIQGSNAGLTGYDLATATFNGAISGAINSGIGVASAGGSTLLSGDGVIKGFVNGATGGAISGALYGYIETGTLNGVWKGAKTGAVIGGIAGAFMGGISAAEDGRNFFTGNKTLAKYENDLTANPVKNGDCIFGHVKQ